MTWRMQDRFAANAGAIRDRAVRLAALGLSRAIRSTEKRRAFARATQTPRTPSGAVVVAASSPPAAELLPEAGLAPLRAARRALMPIVVPRALAGTAQGAASRRAPGAASDKTPPPRAAATARIAAPSQASTLSRRRQNIAALSRGIVPDPAPRAMARAAPRRRADTVATGDDPGGGFPPLSIPGAPRAAPISGTVAQDGADAEPARGSGTTLVLAGELVIDGHRLGQLLAARQSHALTGAPRGSRALNLRAAPMAAAQVPPLP